MKYLILNPILGSSGAIEIDETEYLLINNARINLLEILFIEEKYDLFMGNYLEFETELLSIACKNMIFLESDYFSMSDSTNTISRRVVNLLTTGRMYTDQSVQHISKIYGKKSKNKSTVETEKRTQYDNSLAYRTMEALRNHVQHCGFPIQGLKFPCKWVDFDDQEKKSMHHILIPLINLDELREDESFKKAILGELKLIQKDNFIDIRKLLREYVIGISNIQGKIRHITHQDVVEWENTIFSTLDKYQNKIGSSTSCNDLALFEMKDDDSPTIGKQIFKEFIIRRQDLEKKNNVYLNLFMRCASNELE